MYTASTHDGRADMWALQEASGRDTDERSGAVALASEDATEERLAGRLVSNRGDKGIFERSSAAPSINPPINQCPRQRRHNTCERESVC